MNILNRSSAAFLFACLLSFFMVTFSHAETAPTTKIYDYKYDAVWNTLVSAVSSGHYEIAAIEKDSGILTTKSRLFVSGFNANKTMDQVSYLPSIPMSIWTRGEGELSFKVTSLGDSKTQVTISAKYRTYEEGLTKSWHDCPSNGQNEAMLLDELERRIKDFKEAAPSTGEGEAKAESSSNDVLSKLERLANLKKQGLLTEDELQSQKKKILAEK